MNTNTSHNERPTRWGALLLIAVGLLAFSPLAVLAPAIGWPASLGLPPDRQLALIHANRGAVSLGYSLYLLYSIALTPAMLLLAYHALGSLARPAAATAAAFAALSSLARAVGISRWLTTMPVLATAWAAAPAGEKGVLEATFLAVTEFGGGVGELLGVSLFMAAAVGVLSVSAWRARVLPRALSALGLLTSLFLAGLALPSVGVPVDFPVAVAVSTQSLWLVACGVWMWKRAGATQLS